MDARINVITKTYNNAWLVPYFFRHYDQFNCKYYIWDNMSTDGTRELLQAHPEVTMFDNTDTEFDDYKHRDFKNNAWKDFKYCDWIFNIDFDEFLYHSELMTLLDELDISGINLIKSVGFQMYSDSLPKTKKQIYEEVNTGVKDTLYDKSVIFKPYLNVNYSFGAHECYYTEGTYCKQVDINLLHYKFIGSKSITELLTRNDRLSERNKKEGLSVWPNEAGNRFNPIEYYEFLKQNAKEVI